MLISVPLREKQKSTHNLLVTHLFTQLSVNSNYNTILPLPKIWLESSSEMNFSTPGKVTPTAFLSRDLETNIKLCKQ